MIGLLSFMRLILASASPRRAELLTAAGFSFEVRVADVDERVQVGETPSVYVARLAVEKARRVRPPSPVPGFGAMGPVSPVPAFEDVVVLGADTAVVVDGEIMGKPQDDDDAVRMLTRLSGRTHQVMTGVSLLSAEVELQTVEVTDVTFAALSEAQIASYVASGECQDKAGAYAIQGRAARFIPRISGSYSNVVGLPIATVETLVGLLSRSAANLASHPDSALF
jgi:septum formation protein